MLERVGELGGGTEGRSCELLTGQGCADACCCVARQVHPQLQAVGLLGSAHPVSVWGGVRQWPCLGAAPGLLWCRCSADGGWCTMGR